MSSMNDATASRPSTICPGANPRDDDDVFVEQFAQALERAVTDEREPAARESLAGDFGDSGRLVDPMSICHL